MGYFEDLTKAFDIALKAFGTANNIAVALENIDAPTSTDTPYLASYMLLADTEQADLFCYLGPGDFKLTLWDNRPDSPTYRNRMELCMGANNSGSVVIPKGVVHCYRCISVEPGVVINCPDRLFMGEGRKSPIDEIRHEDDPENPFVLDERARRLHLA